MELTCVVESRARLGEGLCWDAESQLLWWVDILSRHIHCFDPAKGRDIVYDTPEPVGCVAPRIGGGLIVAMANGFHFFDTATGRFEFITDPEADRPGTRFNDGKTDRQGRFWSGSTVRHPDREPRKLAALYRFEPDLNCVRVLEDIGCSNGLAWSPDGRTMYHADSCTPFAWVYEFDPVSGSLANRRKFIDLSSIDGVVDGATVDREGCYWVAVPFGGKVLRFDPVGKLMLTLEVPAGYPTCCEFGGADLETLFVTTATFDRPPTHFGDRPHAGSLFAVDVGVKGVPAARFLA